MVGLEEEDQVVSEEEVEEEKIESQRKDEIWTPLEKQGMIMAMEEEVEGGGEGVDEVEVEEAFEGAIVEERRH